jgi:hypothetical protein
MHTRLICLFTKYVLTFETKTQKSTCMHRPIHICGQIFSCTKIHACTYTSVCMHACMQLKMSFNDRIPHIMCACIHIAAIIFLSKYNEWITTRTCIQLKHKHTPSRCCTNLSPLPNLLVHSYYGVYTYRGRVQLTRTQHKYVFSSYAPGIYTSLRTAYARDAPLR